MAKSSIEYICEYCNAEYMIIYDSDELLEDPVYCPFCGDNSEETDEGVLYPGYSDGDL